MRRRQIMAEFDRCGIRPTPQRIEIATILLWKAQHISADQVVSRLRRKGRRVSKATVYNTLNLFAERGLVRECVVDAERRFYDSNSAPHHHFYNLDTGQLVDIPDDLITLGTLPELNGDVRIESVEVLIKVREKTEKN